MGDCAVVIFYSRKRREVSPAVYLHLHAGSRECDYGDIGDGFGLQEHTELESVRGAVQLPADLAGD